VRREITEVTMQHQETESSGMCLGTIRDCDRQIKRQLGQGHRGGMRRFAQGACELRLYEIAVLCGRRKTDNNIYKRLRMAVRCLKIAAACGSFQLCEAYEKDKNLC
jgi:hypothetical protein